jgi:hypothetical protein
MPLCTILLADVGHATIGDAQGIGSIGSATVKGSVLDAMIGAGFFTENATPKDPDDEILGDNVSFIKSFGINGSADPASYFAAGLFQTAPKKSARCFPT